MSGTLSTKLAAALTRGPWIVLVLLLVAGGASAQVSVFKTRRSASSVTLPLVIGGGFEFESDSEFTQYDVPLLLHSVWLLLSPPPPMSMVGASSAARLKR